tara:strand:- start:12443 stop:14020 length:1578 start_codon:yes stop_codon:yes gene_type:complete
MMKRIRDIRNSWLKDMGKFANTSGNKQHSHEMEKTINAGEEEMAGKNRKKNAPNLTDQQMDRIDDLFAQYGNQKEVSDITGIKTHLIHRYLQWEGRVERPYVNRRTGERIGQRVYTPEERKRIDKFIRENATLSRTELVKSVSLRFNIKSKTVYGWVNPPTPAETISEGLRGGIEQYASTMKKIEKTLWLDRHIKSRQGMPFSEILKILQNTIGNEKTSEHILMKLLEHMQKEHLIFLEQLAKGRPWTIRLSNERVIEVQGRDGMISQSKGKNPNPEWERIWEKGMNATLWPNEQNTSEGDDMARVLTPQQRSEILKNKEESEVATEKEVVNPTGVEAEAVLMALFKETSAIVERHNTNSDLLQEWAPKIQALVDGGDEAVELEKELLSKISKIQSLYDGIKDEAKRIEDLIITADNTEFYISDLEKRNSELDQQLAHINSKYQEALTVIANQDKTIKNLTEREGAYVRGANKAKDDADNAAKSKARTQQYANAVEAENANLRKSNVRGGHVNFGSSSRKMEGTE